MRSRPFFSSGIRASQLMEKYADKPIEPLFSEPPPAIKLTRPQEMALLTLRAFDHGEQILAELYKRGYRKPGRADYESLAQLDLAQRDKSGYHSITPQGSWRARQIVHQIAAEIGVPLINWDRVTRRGPRRVYGMSDSGNA